MKRARETLAQQPVKDARLRCAGGAVVVVVAPAYALSIAVDQDAHGYPLTLTRAGGRNYGVIRGNVGATVTVRATTGPNDDATEWPNVAWTQGVAAGVGQTFDVPIDVAGSFTVNATYQGLNDSLTIWVIWAAVTVDVAGAVPARSGLDFSHAVAGSIVSNPDQLGPHTRGQDAAITGTGRICVTATFVPPNLHTVTQNGRLRLRRYYDEDSYTDGGAVTQDRATRDDTVNDHFRNLVINDHEEIFDLDAPTFAIYGVMNFAAETYMNFTQWAEFGVGAAKNPPVAYQKCSADVTWHFQAEVLGYTPPVLDAHPAPAQQIPVVVGQENITMPRLIVGAGHIALPAQPRYTVNQAGTILFNDGEKP